VSLPQPFTPEPETRTTSVAAASLLLAAFLAVIVFLPGEGRIAAPLHDALNVLLGRAAFMLPLALAFLGVLLVVRRFQPRVAFPRRRIGGVALIALTVLPFEHLLGGEQSGSGAIGRWLSSTLIELFGEAAALLLLLVLLGFGILLAFNVKVPRKHSVEAPSNAES
jgi:hypothetical protein